MKYHIGLDIGSVSINTVIIDKDRWIPEERYDYFHGRPFVLLVEIQRADTETHGAENLCLVGITGTGGPLAASLIGGHYVSETAIIMGSNVGQVPARISGIANILPSTCMPGTLIIAISRFFRSDYATILCVNVAYDGQEDTRMDTRLEAFMYQTKEYANRRKSIRCRADGRAGIG